MQSDNRILGNQLVVMSREDLDALVNEMAQNIVAAQTIPTYVLATNIWQVFRIVDSL